MELTLEVNPESDIYSREDITEIVMAVFQGAIDAERKADQAEKERAEREELEKQRMKELAEQKRGERRRIPPMLMQDQKKEEEEQRGISIDSLLNKDAPQDLFMVLSSKFLAFLAESVRYGIGFCTPRSRFEQGFYPGEKIPVLIDTTDSPRAQRILDKITDVDFDFEAQTDSQKIPNPGGRKSVKEWVKDAEEKKRGRRRGHGAPF